MSTSGGKFAYVFKPRIMRAPTLTGEYRWVASFPDDAELALSKRGMAVLEDLTSKAARFCAYLNAKERQS